MMSAREFAENYVMLMDDFSMNCPPASEVIGAIYTIESAITDEDDATWILDQLEDEIDEYDGDKDTQYHADLAKKLKEEYYSLRQLIKERGAEHEGN